jgi:hypothetical protein
MLHKAITLQLAMYFWHSSYCVKDIHSKIENLAHILIHQQFDFPHLAVAHINE